MLWVVNKKSSTRTIKYYLVLLAAWLVVKSQLWCHSVVAQLNLVSLKIPWNLTFGNKIPLLLEYSIILPHLNWGGHFHISVWYINNEIIHHARYLAISIDPFLVDTIIWKVANAFGPGSSIYITDICYQAHFTDKGTIWSPFPQLISTPILLGTSRVNHPV